MSFIKHVAFIYGFVWIGGLEMDQDLQFYHVSAILEQIWLFYTGERPNWLPMVGHMLAKTHVYDLKHTPRELIGW